MFAAHKPIMVQNHFEDIFISILIFFPPLLEFYFYFVSVTYYHCNVYYNHCIYYYVYHFIDPAGLEPATS